MSSDPMTAAELDEFRKYFGISFSDIGLEEFNRLRRLLQAKYHPDNFEKHGDATIRELAQEKFQQIEMLSNKAKYFLENRVTEPSQPTNDEEIFLRAGAEYAYNGMRIEIITRDKDLKYHLFGTQYRWLEQGDKFNIPKTNASIKIEANYSGVAVGFTETIKMYLSFGTTDSLGEIILWLYQRIAGRASSLVVEGNVVKIDLNEMNYYIRKKSFFQLADSGE